MACSWRAANDDHDRFRRNRQARSANRDIVSVSEPEQAQLVHGERRTTTTIDFEEIVKHEVRIVI